MNLAQILLLAAGALAAALLTSAKIIGADVPPGQIIFSLGIYSFLPSLIYFGLRGDIPYRLYLKAPLLQISMGLGVCAAFWLLLLVLNTNSLLISALLVFMLSALRLAEWYRRRTQKMDEYARLGIELAGFGTLMFALPLLLSATIVPSNLLTLLAFALFAALLGARQSKPIQQRWRQMWPSALGFYASLLAVIVGLFSAGQGWVNPSPAESFHLVWIGVLFGLIQIAIVHAIRLSSPKRFNYSFETGFLVMVTFIEIVYFRERPASNILFALPFFLTALIFMSWQRWPSKGRS
ncbi:hypothetical protein [Maritalea sp. S77]|uniref:hypothetical protein n=1 Tax=Maritalea sp. S77 TaxID=3415125 RepID=UPI003C7BED01